MKLIEIKSNTRQKLALLTAGALAVAPFLNPIAAEAKPPSQAPAHGYYNRDKDDRRDDRRERKEERRERKEERKEDRRDRRDDRWEDRDDRREDRDGDWRRDDRRRDDRRRDDRRRDGDWRDGRDGRDGRDNWPTNQPVNFQGTVVRINSARQLVVRGDNGRTYTVSTNSNLSSRINNGDRVQVVGRTINGGVQANNVRLIDDRNIGNNGGVGSRVNFGGYITRVEGRTLWVRGDNGQTYRVLYNGNTSLRTGDRVRVVGTYNNRAVTATSVTR